MTTLKEHLIMWPILILLAMALLALIYGIHQSLGQPGPVMYNCSIAEISPDFTPAMKEACRRKGIKYDSSKTSY